MKMLTDGRMDKRTDGRTDDGQKVITIAKNSIIFSKPIKKVNFEISNTKNNPCLCSKKLSEYPTPLRTNLCHVGLRLACAY